ncbi:MAG: hypothetical protein H6Q88_913, partial [Anaeromyxobacteraceae bacterium]|nr:hypothetical protein [Anaeromyxobacteraceae bacterium]
MTSDPVRRATPPPGKAPRSGLLPAAAGVGAALVVAWGMAFAWGNSAPGSSFIRERAEKALR